MDSKRGTGPVEKRRERGWWAILRKEKGKGFSFLELLINEIGSNPKAFETVSKEIERNLAMDLCTPNSNMT